MPRRQTPSGRRTPAARRKRNQFILFGLLFAIVVLLVVIIGLIPDVVPRPQSADRGGSTARPAPEGTQPGSPVSSGEPEGSVEFPGRGTDEGATETYPDAEASKPEPEASEENPLWWLPDPSVYTGKPGTLYLILDDAGNSIDPLPEFLKFPGPMAVAVLPQLRYSVEAAARTAAAGKEIMLHQPMEAVGGSNPGPGVLAVGMGPPEIEETLRENLATVPGAIGVNNHMGSLATADPDVMRPLLTDLRARDLFFVDSRTTVDSVGRETAEEVDVRFAERNVFLDNERDRDSMLGQLRRALELAHEQDSVLMIGHATVPELADLLNEIYPILQEYGYEFGAVSSLVRDGRDLAQS